MKHLAFVLCMVLLSRSSLAAVAKVWAVNDGEKVDLTDLKNPNREKNSAWDGKTIHIFGAKNEIIAFQAIVETDDKGAQGLSAQLAELAGPDGKKIVYAPPREDPTDFVGRPIEIFTAHYIEIKQPTDCNWIYDVKSPAAPVNPLGFKPVILCPENAKAGKGGFPMTVPASSTQAIWFEVYTARDLPAGTYKGNVVVKAGDQTITVPLELELFDFTLPDTNSMKAMLYFEPDQVENYQGKLMDDRYHRFAHRQRVELVDGYSQNKVNQTIGRFNGKDFSAEQHYEGPGQDVGNVIVPATFYGPGRQFDEEQSAHKAADSWMEFLNKTVPNATTFVYLPDEPSRREFPHILSIGKNIHDNPGPGKKLPLFVTHSISADLAPAIDIWCTPTESFNVAAAARERAAGKQVWVYNGMRPFAGSFVYESPATDPRATMWGCFKYEIPAYFYWHCDHWHHNSQKPTDRDQNIWADAITFDNRKQPNKNDRGAANGDGVILYPGQEIIHPDEDRGIEGPCGSYQMANLRRGLQDHLYLTMARQLKLDSVVTETTNAVAGKMFSEAGKTIGFAQTGNEFEAARYKLAQAIVKAKAGK